MEDNYLSLKKIQSAHFGKNFVKISLTKLLQLKKIVHHVREVFIQRREWLYSLGWPFEKRILSGIASNGLH